MAYLVFDRTNIAAPIEIRDEDEAANGLFCNVDLLSVDMNALTYGIVGDRLHYWSLFPLVDDQRLGRLPAWGIATVRQTVDGGPPVGTHLYGVWPVGTSAQLTLEPCGAGEYREISDFRAKAFGLYNQYRAVPDIDGEKSRCVLRPQFSTAGLLVDALRYGLFPEPRQLCVTGAGSKTAVAIAFLARRHLPGLELIGLSSPALCDAVRRLDLYHHVLSYEDIGDMPVAGPVAVADLCSSEPIAEQLYSVIGERLSSYLGVGVTHRRDFPQGRTMPGPVQPIPFFAPLVAQQIAAGMDGDEARMTAAIVAHEADWQRFAEAMWDQFDVAEVLGLQAAAERIGAMVAGQRVGHWILRPGARQVSQAPA